MTELNDRYSERRELVGAGWEPKDIEETVVWKNPANDYWYQHDLALQLAREGAGNHVPRRRGAGRREET
jgi:hypothetical protein